MTEAATPPPVPREARRPRDTARVLRWVLVLQLVFGGVLLGSDMLRVLPQLVFPSTAPQLTQPVGPGDQTRRYRPGEVELREPRPGTRPVPSTTDMPSRLDFVDTSWNGDPVITLTGQIAPGDGARFAEFMARVDPVPATAFLNSPGGSVTDALSIGRALREAGVATAMTATDICLSACPYILASGTSRTVDPDALVGVHQHFFDANTALPAFLAVETIQRGQGEVMAYLDEMGVDPMLMQPALLTPSDEIYILTPDELRETNLVTDETGDETGD